MKKLTLLFCISVLLSIVSWAQQASINGHLIDTTNKQSLQHAVVSMIKQKDSVLLKYTRADANGNFELKNIPAGNYILQITYPQYADYVDNFTLENNSNKSLGTIALIQKAKLLEEVIVKQKISSIRIKGDTTEYKADSFKVGANANVQDLLKRMPGIQVNSKGEITTQGQKVEKILVDGEEFFIDDPAVVTQTLRADAVNTVQVFDKKSDQATFSGIDDGVKTKTINLQLKDDKKKGYFGKAEGGTDFDYYKSGKILANAFKGKRKIAGYITYDNTKFQSLNWQERDNYGGNLNNNTEFGDDGSIYFYNNSDEFSNSQGLPNAVTAGLQYSKKWNQDKQNINGNYQYNNLRVTGINKTITQNILGGDSSFNNTQEQNFTSFKTRNRIKTVYDWTIDSMSSLKVTIGAGIVTGDNSGRTIGSSRYVKDSVLINETDRYSSSLSNNKSLNTTLFYRKRFQKKGRTISITSDFNFSNNTNTAYLKSLNNYYSKLGAVSKNENIDQFKPNEDNSKTIATKVSYTEPLWKNTFLELNYKYALNTNDASRITYSKGISDYNQLVDSLSNHYLYNNQAHTGGFNVRYTGKKFNFAAGTGLGTVTFKQTDVFTSNKRNINFTNILPAANISYNFTKQSRLYISYTGNTRNPSLQQIQPLRDNSDPLNINIGNPNLQQEFTNTYSLNFNDYKVLKGRGIYISTNFSTVNNAISNSSNVDTSGRRVNQSINVDGNYNGRMYFSYSITIFKKINLGFDFNPSIRRNINYVNNQKNINDNLQLGYNINFNYNSDKWLSFYFGVGANHNSSKSSINNGIETKYWTYESYGGTEMKLPKKWYLNIDEDITVYQKTAAFANQKDIYIVNASIKKSISKDENWQIKASVNDIFNQNQGVTRNITSNFITETSNQTIQRYFLLTLIFNFSKNGKPSN
ncbi:outer membrane beta-barrel family protein [Parasediminibacterium paludis]|uniref:Outer membrane beta-barrel family protein n=1 Tax=Parasediminibacterium paludis TaxID=908966 RepID=A0ABV8PUT7_9BACT